MNEIGFQVYEGDFSAKIRGNIDGSGYSGVDPNFFIYNLEFISTHFEIGNINAVEEIKTSTSCQPHFSKAIQIKNLPEGISQRDLLKKTQAIHLNDVSFCCVVYHENEVFADAKGKLIMYVSAPTDEVIETELHDLHDIKKDEFQDIQILSSIKESNISSMNDEAIEDFKSISIKKTPSAQSTPIKSPSRKVNQSQTFSQYNEKGGCLDYVLDFVMKFAIIVFVGYILILILAFIFNWNL